MIFVKIRFINFVRLGLHTAANLALAKLNLIDVNFRHRDPHLQDAKFDLVKFGVMY
nr:hypothetical protein [uncultured Campylobacter sp.]